MFERYTERARRALFFARVETSRLGGDEVDCGHLLLGLLRVASGLSERVFARANLTYDDARREIEAQSAGRTRHDKSVELPFAPAVRRLLAYAAEEAGRLSHSHIGTEHLLLGLLREEQDDPQSLVHVRGIRADDVGDAIAAHTGDAAGAADPHEDG